MDAPDGISAEQRDVEAVAALARRHDPGLPVGLARELAALAWRHLMDDHDLDAPAVARLLLAERRDSGATPAAVVARAAVDTFRGQ